MLETTGGASADVIAPEDIIHTVNRKDTVVTDIVTVKNKMYFGILYPVMSDSDVSLLRRRQ